MHLFCIHGKGRPESFFSTIFLTSRKSLPSAFSYLLLVVYVELIVNDLDKSHCSWQKLSLVYFCFFIIYITDDNQLTCLMTLGTMPFLIPQSLVVETTGVVFFIFSHAASQRSHHKRLGMEQNYKGSRTS